MMPALLLSMSIFQTIPGTSLYTQRPEDPKAVVIQARGDGATDDTDAIQKSVDRVEGQGIVLLPEGRYRISRTLVVPPGVRVFGFGAHRPSLVLAPNTPGWQETERIMVFFSGRRGMGVPEVPASGGRGGADFGLPGDANPGTFYSAMANVDLEIGEGNGAAVGVRGRYAQHCYLAHMDFRLRSGLAAIHDTGNEAHDLRFFGGQYGIITRTPSPGWPFLLMDSHFEGQSKAAILTRTAGLTLVRPTFRHVPTAVEADIDHSEQLWMQDARLEDVSGPAIVVSRENALRTQIAVENATCLRVPTLLGFRESAKTLASKGDAYVVRDLSHGLRYPSLGAEPKVETHLDDAPVATLPPPPPTDVTPLPPMAEWADLRVLGAKGDGVADDTAILKKAVAEHRTIYLPQGRYRVTDTILLRPDTVLVGLNPITTQIVLADATPGYAGDGGRSAFAGASKALLETPKGGTNLVSGIGLDSGGDNPAAVAALWRSGEGSTMEDVKFVGGHGSGVPIYDADHTMDPDPNRRWDSQYPSLWVTDGGGGTFRNLWTASTFASAGMLVSDTETPGRVYGVSSEHHVRQEIQVRNAAHWRFVALQTEEERGESSACLPIEVERSRDILFANLNMYRVVSVVQPFPTAVRTTDAEVRLRNVHCYSNAKVSFDDLLIADGRALRQREFAALDLIPRSVGAVKSDSRVTLLATGFSNISGGAVAPNGDFLFVDARWHRILRWDGHRVTIVSDAPLAPVNLAFDRAGDLMVVSYAGKGMVYTIGNPLSAPGERGQGVRGPGEIVTLHLIAAAPRSGATAVLPVSDWTLDPALTSGRDLTHSWHVVSPDGSTFLPVTQEFVDGTLTWGVKLQPEIRAFGLAPAVPGRPFYVTGESEMRTYTADVLPDGTLAHPRLFCEQGGEGIALGLDGRVYLAAGEVYVYSPKGHLVDTIRVPERPTQVAFGGPDGRTLFICARTSLYTIRP